MRKKFVVSTMGLVIAFNVALACLLAWLLYSNHAARVQRIERCTAECQYDYTKYSIHPQSGSYDICVKACDVRD